MSEFDLAITGMAGRFPAAADLDRFWDNLRRGVDGLTTFGRDELVTAGVRPELAARDDYVPRRGKLDDVGLFDAAFFGMSPREARLVDPQIRLFLEAAWQALEDGALDPRRFAGPVGVYAGMSQPSYVFDRLLGNREALVGVSPLELKLGNDKDFLATLASYRLDLKGPSINVATACSTSLVAVHLAGQALLARECDAALAGGVSVAFPQVGGYLYQPGGIMSRDGRTRSFDAEATGTVGSDGVGVVLLRRLDDALADCDPVRAVIRASAVNNDGATKIGFTAPSVEGQAAAIGEAQSLAGVDADTLTYIECHGSATPLGDPVEIRALERAFRASTREAGFCAVGSVKSSIGHTDAAAGVAGLIKTVLALEHRQIPPSLHFESPNPEIRFEGSPFFVADRLLDWKPATDAPRRAGVSAFGIGGTNAHVIVEEAPERGASPPAGRSAEVLLLSAATPRALEEATDRLAAHLEDHPDQPFADVAHTTRVGRRAFHHRRALVVPDAATAVAALAERGPALLESGPDSADGRPVVFLLPGVGDQYPGLAADLMEREPVFRREMDRAGEILASRFGIDLAAALAAADPGTASGGTDFARMVGRSGGDDATDGGPLDRPLDRTAVAHPAVFAVEVALGRLLLSWGVVPSALLGYSVGEYAAACLAGVLSFEDGLVLVAERSRRIEELPPGAMVTVALGEDDLAAEIADLVADGVDGLELAAVNGPEVTVAAGPQDAVAALGARLDARGVSHRRPAASHAFHTSALEPATEGLRTVLEGVRHGAAERPWVSAVDGSIVSVGETVEPEHWVRHMVRPVRFADALATLWETPELGADAALAEVGPGQGLVTLALQQAPRTGGAVGVPLIRPGYEGRDDQTFLLEGLARLWLAGVEVDWSALAEEGRRKVALPTYPFQRQRHLVERAPKTDRPEAGEGNEATTEALPPRPAAPAVTEPPPAHARPDQVRTRYVAPRDETERRVAAVWGEILEIDRVGIHDSFFELGGTSLLAPRLLAAVERRTGVAVPLPTLLAQPTVADLAAAVAAGGADEAPSIEDPASVALAPDVLPAEERPELPDTGATVVLTGGTGFLGAHLLAELLAAGHRVVCLARADDTEAARKRLLANLEAHRLTPEGDAADRIEPLPGDLAAPLWGLDGEGFARLARRADAVVHAGAWVNFTYPYAALAPANVGGTEVAIRLAAAERSVPLAFVSSLSVLGLGADTPDAGEPAPGDPSRLTGYPASKWAGERLVAQGLERGLDATIFRPGVIAGDLDAGINNPRDLVWAFVKGSLQLGLVPPVPGGFDPVPVDFVARAVVALGLRRASSGGVFDLVHPQPLPWPEVFDVARSLGYDVEAVGAGDWWRALARHFETPEGETHALAPFRPLFVPALAAARSAAEDPGGDGGDGPPPEVLPEQRFDLDRSTDALKRVGLSWPPLDRSVVALYLESMIASGFLTPPTAGGIRRP